MRFCFAALSAASGGPMLTKSAMVLRKTRIASSCCDRSVCSTAIKVPGLGHRYEITVSAVGQTALGANFLKTTATLTNYRRAHDCRPGAENSRDRYGSCHASQLVHDFGLTGIQLCFSVACVIATPGNAGAAAPSGSDALSAAAMDSARVLSRAPTTAMTMLRAT